MKMALRTGGARSRSRLSVEWNHSVNERASVSVKNVVFTPLDLRVVPTKPVGERGFYALAIDDAGTGRGFAPIGNANCHKCCV